MKTFLKNKKGFTLTELMIVVVILGILVLIAVPIYNNVTDKAEKKYM
jgi:type IV pilus assembly protein PilA